MNEDLKSIIEEKSKKLAKSQKLVRDEKKIYTLVMYYMFYNRRIKIFSRDMGLSPIIINGWIEQHGKQAEEIIANYRETMKKGIVQELGLAEGDIPTPTIDSIKANILTRIQDSIATENDPSKLANALKILDKYQKDEQEEKSNKKTSIYDDIKGGMKR